MENDFPGLPKKDIKTKIRLIPEVKDYLLFETDREWKENYLRRMGEFPDEARDYVSSLSSSFLEADIYQMAVSNESVRREIKFNLGKQGLNTGQIQETFKYFNLPLGEDLGAKEPSGANN